MCNDCNIRTYGKKAIVALVEAQHQPKSVCERRYKFLEQSVESFRDWLTKQGCEDSNAVVEAVETETIKLLKEATTDEFIWSREDHDKQDGLIDIHKGTETSRHRMDDEYMQYVVYHRSMEENARKAEVKADNYIEATWVKWLEGIQDIWEANNNYLPKDIWRKCTQARNSLNRQRKAKQLDYRTWAMLSNWNNKLLSNKKRYEIADEPESHTDQDVVDIFYTVRHEAEQELVYGEEF